MKIIITGGHFSPALSIIEKIDSNDEILVVGRKYTFEGENSFSFEYRICQEKNIPFREIRAGRLQRKLTKHTIPALLKFPQGLIDSYNILRSFNPDVILTFGGYISLPVALSAYLLGIPVVLHEQVQHSGFSNRLISNFASKICVSFPTSMKHFPKKKTILTGNPIRREVFTINKKYDIQKGKKVIYITGGSGGSHFINNIISIIIKDLLEKYTIIHQTGDSSQYKDYEKLEKIRENLGKDQKERYILKKFIYPDEIGWIYQNTDLVIARSGANTFLELIALSKPGLFIPLPYSQAGEQLENATLAKDLGIADYIEQSNVTPQIMLDKINQILLNIQKYKIDEKTIKQYIFYDADDKIIDVLKSVYYEKKKT